MKVAVAGAAGAFGVKHLNALRLWQKSEELSIIQQI